MSGISNFQIEEAFKKIDDKDILENFVSVFPSNRMNKFINHAVIISETGKYSMAAYRKLTKKEIDSISETARNFFYFINAFGLKHRLRSFVNLWMVEDRVQDLDSATCRIFQIYFSDNLLNPDLDSGILNKTKLKKTMVEKFLNELFYFNNINENELKMESYADEMNITIN